MALTPVMEATTWLIMKEHIMTRSSLPSIFAQRPSGIQNAQSRLPKVALYEPKQEQATCKPWARRQTCSVAPNRLGQWVPEPLLLAV